MMDTLSADILLDRLSDSSFGQHIVCLPECDSTNRAARDLAEAGAPDGTLVITDFQTAGRGRLSRRWSAPRGTSLLFSLLLRPAIPAARAAQIGMAAGLGAVEGIRRATGVETRLKWPNDILAGGRKLAGMLSDACIAEEAIRFFILGMGINVNFDPADIPEIPSDATSLMLCVGHELARIPLLREILAAIETPYRAVGAGTSLRVEWSRALDTLEREVRLTLPEGELAGIAEDVDEDGALILRMRDGTRKRISAGDVLAA